jgi:hypothetical protein
MVARDPVYLVEPEIISKSFRLSRDAARLFAKSVWCLARGA